MSKEQADNVADELRRLGYEAYRSPSDAYIPYTGKGQITYSVFVTGKHAE